MPNTTVSLSKWMDPCPLSQLPLQSCRWALLLCLPLFHGGFVLRLRTLIPGMHRADLRGGLLRRWAAFFSYRSRSLTPLPQRPSCGFPKKHAKTDSVTHAWQSVITGALYCVFMLKVVQVSICLSAWQRCTHRQHIQAASLVNVSSALACLTEKEHFSPRSSVGSHLFLMLYQQFSPPLPIVLKSPFIFKLAPSKVLLSGDC